jgi:hypothetical protein
MPAAARTFQALASSTIAWTCFVAFRHWAARQANQATSSVKNVVANADASRTA